MTCGIKSTNTQLNAELKGNSKKYTHHQFNQMYIIQSRKQSTNRSLGRRRDRGVIHYAAAEEFGNHAKPISRVLQLSEEFALQIF